MLASTGKNAVIASDFRYYFSLEETYLHKREEHVRELQRKEEEMRQMFVVRVKEKEAELKEAEKEVRN